MGLKSNPYGLSSFSALPGRLSELFRVVLCTEAVHSHKHT